MTLEIPSTLVINYALLLTRSTGFVTFVPIPGLKTSPAMPKIVLAVLLTILGAPLARGVSDDQFFAGDSGIWLLVWMIFAEAALGIALGAAVGLLLEAFGLAAQILGFQAGYSYVNMIDPTTQVDASILNVMMALLASLLFFGFGLHLQLLRAWFAGLEHWPLGAFFTRPVDALRMVHLGSLMFQTAVRLSFPVIAVLLLVDLTLGLLNQINARLQLLTLAFPVKILGAVALMFPLLALAPKLFRDLAERTFELIWATVTR